MATMLSTVFGDNSLQLKIIIRLQHRFPSDPR